MIAPAPDAARLLDRPAAELPGLPRLTVTADLDEALGVLEAELIRRSRILAAHETGDVPALRDHVPEEEPLPVLVLLASPPPHGRQRLATVLTLGARLGIAAVLLGDWPAGMSCHIDPAGLVTATTGQAAESEQTADKLTGVRLFGLPADDAHDLLTLLRAARGLPDTPPAATAPTPAGDPQPGPADATQTAPGVTDRPGRSPTAPAPTAFSPVGAPVTPAGPPEADPADGPPVRVRLFGPPRIHAADAEITTGLRNRARELAAYLALHPDGLTAETITAALWADADPDTALAQFRTNLGNLRAALRAATGRREHMYLTYSAGRYRIDPDLVTVDAWEFQAALADADTAKDPGKRAAALARALDLYTGDLVERCYDEWAEPLRVALRRQAADAASRLAELVEPAEPERALSALETAAGFDRYNEDLYRHIMRIQARLRRPDAIRRTLELAHARMSELDAEPEPDTIRLANTLLHQPNPTTGPVGSTDP